MYRRGDIVQAFWPDGKAGLDMDGQTKLIGVVMAIPDNGHVSVKWSSRDELSYWNLSGPMRLMVIGRSCPMALIGPDKEV